MALGLAWVTSGLRAQAAPLGGRGPLCAHPQLTSLTETTRVKYGHTSEHTDRITRHSPPKTINHTWPDTRAPHFRTCVVATCWLLLSLVQRRGVPGGVGDRRSRSPARRIADRTSSRDAAAAVTSHQLHGRRLGRGRIWLAGARAAQESEGQEDGGKGAYHGALAAGTVGGAWSLGSTVCTGGTGCGEDAGVGCDQLAGLVLRWGRYVTQAAGR